MIPLQDDTSSTPTPLKKQALETSLSIPSCSHTKQPLEPTPRHRSSLAAEIFFIAVVCAAQLLTQAGLAVGIALQPFPATASSATTSWFSAGYSLTVGTCILPAGRLGDVLGHKRFLVGGFLWLGAWSALAGAAVYRGPVLFTFCRAMQGVGPAMMLPNAVAILGRAYDPGSRRQHMVFSLFGATAPSGFVVGAVFASLLGETAWWPWAYWVLCFACVLLAVLAVFAVPATVKEGTGKEGDPVWRRIDLLGSIAGVAALILFNFAWNQGPVVGWTQPYTYSIMIVGILVFLAFVWIEKRATHPLIPFGVLGSDSLLTLSCISAGWSSFGIFVVYTWTFVVQYRHTSPLLTSAQFSPVALSGLCAAIGTGIALSKLRPSTVMVVSMVGFAAGGAILATMPVQQTYWGQEFVGLIILPWGMDMSFPAATIILSRAMPREHQGLAASLVNTFVNYSVSIGLGFAGTVDSNMNDGGKNLLRGLRGAQYMGVGLAGLGVAVAMLFCLVERHQSNKSGMDQGAEKEVGSA